jgi:hypothetical protein
VHLDAERVVAHESGFDDADHATRVSQRHDGLVFDLAFR